MGRGKRFVPRAEVAAAAVRAPRIDAKRLLADLEAPRYRAVKLKDYGNPGHVSWMVYDSAKLALGELTRVANCLSGEAAQLVVDALNAYQTTDVAANAKAAVRAMLARKHWREDSWGRMRFVAEAASAEREVQKGGRTYTVDEAFGALKPKNVARRSRR